MDRTPADAMPERALTCEVLVGEIGVEGGGDGGDVAGAGGENVGIGRGRVVLLGEVSGTDGGDSVVDDDGFW